MERQPGLSFSFKDVNGFAGNRSLSLGKAASDI